MELFDGGFLLMMILLMVLGALATVGWWVAVIYFGVKTWQAAERQLRQELPALEQVIHQYASLPAGQRAALQATIMGQLGQMNNHFSQLDALHRQRYETRVSELHGMAASAGLDWTPPSY